MRRRLPSNPLVSQSPRRTRANSVQSRQSEPPRPEKRTDTSRGSRISLAHKPSPALSLGASDVLKLTFQVVDKEDGKGVQPHQTFLRFYDEVSGEEGIQPVKVSSSGKAKFDLVRSTSPL